MTQEEGTAATSAPPTTTPTLVVEEEEEETTTATASSNCNNDTTPATIPAPVTPSSNNNDNKVDVDMTVVLTTTTTTTADTTDDNKETGGDVTPTTTTAAAASPTAVPPHATNQPPKRNPSTGSTRSGPLPTIEECLFGGIPKDLDKARERGDNSNDNDDENAFFYVPLNLLRRVSSQGIDDDDEKAGSHRGLVWRLLLGFLPSDRREWDTVAAKQRDSYHSFVQELFCIDDRDVDGSELRGHHSKRHTDKALTKKERRERRKRNNKIKKEQQEAQKESGKDGPRCPIKFVVDDDEPHQSTTATTGPTSSEFMSAASVSEDDETDIEDDEEGGGGVSRKNRNRDDMDSSISDLLQDDPSLWNMSVREQKILERLTNHEAVNQLLVKRDCKEWNNFLENATLLDEIRKDVNRTHPHLYFYLEPNDQLGARRYGALERILFVWAKLNKGVRYVQGMNEIVGTLYYVLANDFNEQWADHAEADTYILFNIIMSEMRDIFVADMDTADTGIVGRIDNMQNLLHLHDPQVKSHLVDMGIDASFYAVRWLTTLLSREFLLPDTIRLWDSMFASTHKENFLRYVCVTMVLKIRDQLLLADFSTCLQLLQKYPSCSMDDLLDSSRALWIYESQITMACLKGGLTLHQALQAIPPPEKVIMAFGLRGGVALTNREQLQQAGAAVKNNVNKGVQSLSNAGQGILGGARRFLQGRIRRSKSTEGLNNSSSNNNKRMDESATNNNNSNNNETPSNPQRRVPFRTFSFAGRSRSEGDNDAEEIDKNNDDDVANGAVIPRSVSDTDAL